MSRHKKIIGIAMLLVVLAGVGVAWTFQNEIQAVMYYLKYTPEEQAALEQENENKMEEALEQANLSTETVNKEQEKMTQEKDDIKNKQQAAVKPDAPKQDVQKPEPKNEIIENKETLSEKNAEEQSPEEEQKQEYDAVLASMVGEIYALRSSFVGQLDDLLEQAKDEYVALSPEERKKQKMSLASKYINIAGGLEASCDQQMEDILGRIQAHLKETGGDLSLIDEIREVYKNEKALKKSYYMSLLD